MNKRFGILVFGMGMLIAGTCGATAHHNQPSNQSSAQQSPDFRGVRVPDSKRQIAQLTRKLKLKSAQKKGVLAILADRDRNIKLIQESEALSNDAKASRISAIVADYNAHIEDLLNGKQRHKFEQVLIRQREREEKNRQAATGENAHFAG
ncbi:MAG: hypothetical protein ABSA96_14495 [Candidatus Acidiferrales bacterium]|jgi:hypothetical protein